MLEKLNGLNTELGMSYCLDDEDIYREVLEEYVNSDKTAELEEFFTKKDWKNYQIRIHGVKSTSLTIGAEELSKNALALETACKEDREDFLLENHESFMRDYKAVLETVAGAVQD